MHARLVCRERLRPRGHRFIRGMVPSHRDLAANLRLRHISRQGWIDHDVGAAGA
jgi:hypothetical protein